ncbi:hypothetical protein AGMMS50268_31110 [Spirochaetia bacterium]|nr:hypothetical protein AGMMS50268_31110 [Spirochaetia bacterium]
MLRIRSVQAVCIPAVCGLLFFASFSGCASAPPPPWAYSPESVYPRAEYLTGRGTGPSRAEAETAALAEIARIFGVAFSSTARGRETFSTRNGNTEESRELSTETLTRTYTELFSLKYADPWRNPQTKQWEALAYINRQEAWETYEPRLRSVTASFMTAFEAAGAADDPLSQYSRYRAVARLGNEDGGAGDMLKYAQALYPEKAREFAAAQNALAGVPAKIQAVLDWAVISVRCTGDFENIVTGAIIEAFRQGGFKTADGASRGTNRAEAAIDEGKETLEAGTFYTPRITLTVSGEGKPLFIWTASAARQGAWDAAVAKRQAWNALTVKIRESLLREFNTAMEGGIK